MTAAEIRSEWMRAMGLSEREIAEANVIEPPVDAEYEQLQLDTVRAIGFQDWGRETLSDDIR